MKPRGLIWQFILPGSCRAALAKTQLPDACQLYYVDRLSEALDIIFD